MLRRRLVLSSSSEEEDGQPIHNQSEAVSDIPNSVLSGPNPDPNPNPTLSHSSDQPLEISDDEEEEDFVDVSDNLSPPVPEHISSDEVRSQPRPESTGGCQIREFILALGLRLNRDWFVSCLQGLEQFVPGFNGLEVGAKAKLCFEKFLVSDMNFSGGGVLPENIDRLHSVSLPGPFVLQVDEIVNISCPLKGRYQKAPPGVKRCLKLSLTDGVRRVFGMEYRPIKDLDALAPAGLKVVICNVHIHRGLLMLVPEAFEVLGGLVEELEAARQRLVEEVNKPPRGIRTRNSVVPPLRDRATLAAWTPNGDRVAEAANCTMPEYTTPIQVRPRGATHVVPGNDANRRIEEESPGIVSEESVARFTSSTAVRMSVEELPFPGDEGCAIPNPSVEVVMGSAEAPDVSMGAEYEDVRMFTIPDSTTNAVHNSFSDIASVVEETDMDNMDTISCTIQNPVPDPSLNSVPNNEEATNPIPGPSLSNVSNDDEVLEVEHPLRLSGSREVPFTYMAILSAKWISMKESTHSLKGIIKCILTGVKGFKFRDQPSYELQAYVDDGSLICEIIIHHRLVQKMVGYSPQEVTAAITSSDKARSNDMKETMRQFQSFLANFEGKMLVEMNKTSPLPVALEMHPGCSESDARLLLRRLKSSIQSRNQPSMPMDPICLSP